MERKEGGGRGGKTGDGRGGGGGPPEAEKAQYHGTPGPGGV